MSAPGASSSSGGSSGALPRSVGVVGLGVMGGSLARALSGRGARVVGHSPDPDEVQAAMAVGAIVDTGTSVAATAEGVEWWIVATPLAALEGAFGAASSSVPGAVMDVASLQAAPLAWSAAAGLGDRHVSAHPMVGSERSGFEASRDDLYEGAPVWLSASRECDPGIARRAEAFWRALGAVPEWIDADEHDGRMAAASHLPQLTATALALVLERSGLSPEDLGPGGRDTTRLAASSPVMWRDLLAQSRGRVAPLLRGLAAEAAQLATLLEAGDLDAIERVLRKTRSWRQS